MAWKAKANITRHLGKGQEGYKTDRKQNCFPWSKGPTRAVDASTPLTVISQGTLHPYLPHYSVLFPS